jgi:membrane protease YdiL (CAAX protease family)
VLIGLRAIRAISLTLVWFLAVYAPASAIAAILRLQLAATVPFVMLLTLLAACLLIWLLASRGRQRAADYGFRLPAPGYIASAVLVSAPISVIIALLLSHAHEAGPLAGLKLSAWLIGLYFVVGAPVQEEVIFRGLLQTTLANRGALAASSPATSGVAALLWVALLFGAIHLVVGPCTAAAAFVLGAIAGELRRRSGSLIPAVICHAFFNLGAILWA